LLLVLAPILAASLDARAEPPPAKEWEVEILPYVWAPGIDGSVETPNGGTEHFDVGARDLLQKLELGAMGRVNVRWKRWLAVVDGLWTKLGHDEEVRRQRVSLDADLDLQMAFAQALAGYRVFQRPGGLLGDASPGDERVFGLDVLAGANYTWLDTQLDLELSTIVPLPRGQRRLGGSRDWVAPAIALRLHNDFTPRIRLETLGALGGFSVGDAPRLSWQLTTLLSYRFTDHWLVSAGHRLIAAEDGAYDLRMHGVMVGVGYRF
jgi:hypothetical protein